MYDYYKAMKEDVLDYIKEEVNFSDYSDRDELEEALQDRLWTVDSVTGNGSGSYTFNTWTAKEYVLDNIDLLAEACQEFGQDVVNLLDEDWEAWDVTIRCYLLGQTIAEALDELEDELEEAFNEDEDEDEDED